MNYNITTFIKKNKDIKIMKSFFQNYLLNCVPNYILSVLFYGTNKELHYYLSTSKKYLNNLIIFTSLHYNTTSKLFTDLAAIDFIHKDYRFELIYNILSLQYHNRMFICLWTDELSSVPSLINIFPNINWFEREVWDLFGIHFSGNNDLRRILTDYGFVGNPLRKDFPLSGFVELYYSNSARLVCYRNISLIQDYRYFNTLSPWNYFSSFYNH